MKTAEGNARRRGRGKKNAEEGRRAGRGRAPGAWSPRVCRPRLRRSRPGNCCDGGRRVSARRRERARTAGDGRVASERKRRTGAARAAHHRVSSHDPHRLVHEHARGDERGDGDGAHDLPRRVGVHLGAVPGDRPGVRATAIWRPKLRRRRVVGREPAPVSRAQKARVVSDVTSASVESGAIGAALAVARCFDYTARRGETTAVRP